MSTFPYIICSRLASWQALAAAALFVEWTVNEVRPGQWKLAMENSKIVRDIMRDLAALRGEKHLNFVLISQVVLLTFRCDYRGKQRPHYHKSFRDVRFLPRHSKALLGRATGVPF